METQDSNVFGVQKSDVGNFGKSSKNRRCKENAAKLKAKHLAKSGVKGLQKFNERKRERINLKKEAERLQFQKAMCSGLYLLGTEMGNRMNRQDEEISKMKKKLEEKDEAIRNERAKWESEKISLQAEINWLQRQ